jgi:hypothetical protein
MNKTKGSAETRQVELEEGTGKHLLSTLRTILQKCVVQFSRLLGISLEIRVCAKKGKHNVFFSICVST